MKWWLLVVVAVAVVVDIPRLQNAEGERWMD